MWLWWSNFDSKSSAIAVGSPVCFRSSWQPQLHQWIFQWPNFLRNLLLGIFGGLAAAAGGVAAVVLLEETPGKDLKHRIWLNLIDSFRNFRKLIYWYRE
jgi:hypothetical protein